MSKQKQQTAFCCLVTLNISTPLSRSAWCKSSPGVCNLKRSIGCCCCFCSAQGLLVLFTASLFSLSLSLCRNMSLASVALSRMLKNGPWTASLLSAWTCFEPLSCSASPQTHPSHPPPPLPLLPHHPQAPPACGFKQHQLTKGRFSKKNKKPWRCSSISISTSHIHPAASDKGRGVTRLITPVATALWHICSPA